MRRLGLLFASAGVVVWMFGIAAWVMGVWVTMPPATVRLLVLSLSALLGAALLVVGAMVAKAGRKSGKEDDFGVVDAHASPQLGQAPETLLWSPRRDVSPVPPTRSKQ